MCSAFFDVCSGPNTFSKFFSITWPRSNMQNMWKSKMVNFAHSTYQFDYCLWSIKQNQEASVVYAWCSKQAQENGTNMKTRPKWLVERQPKPHFEQLASQNRKAFLHQLRFWRVIEWAQSDSHWNEAKTGCSGEKRHFYRIIMVKIHNPILLGNDFRHKIGVGQIWPTKYEPPLKWLKMGVYAHFWSVHHTAFCSPSCDSNHQLIAFTTLQASKQDLGQVSSLTDL